MLKGKFFATTGALSEGRKTFKKYIEDNGGIYHSSVGFKTDYLIAGEGGGNKRSKAKVLNIPIITEKEFWDMVNNID